MSPAAYTQTSAQQKLGDRSSKSKAGSASLAAQALQDANCSAEGMHVSYVCAVTYAGLDYMQ